MKFPRRKFLHLAASAAALPALSRGARAQDEEQTRVDIRIEYERLAAALANKNLSAVAAFYAADYRLVETDGWERTLIRAMVALERDLRSLKGITIRSAVDDVSLQGHEAVVVARRAWSGTIEELQIHGPWRAEIISRDSWTKTDQGWRIRRSVVLKEKAWINDILVRDQTYEAPLPATERSTLVREIVSRAIAFNTVVAGSGFDDLESLDAVIGDARIVSLGEASHGTAEFFQMKHRLLEYLVLKKGFTVFAIESNWPETEAVDRYVKTGTGDAAAAVRAMVAAWHTEEVRAMVAWMADQNNTRGRRTVLSFGGFDIQQVATAKNYAIDFFGRLGSAEQEALRQLYDGVERLEDYYRPVPVDEIGKMRARAAEALKLFDDRREALTRVATPAEFIFARQCARIVYQACEFYFRYSIDVMQSMGERDRMMAENVHWLIEEAYPNQKIVLWAHNSHVATSPFSDGGKSMGMHLREAFGNQMVVLGFASERGTIRAWLVQDGHEVPGGWISIKLNPAHPYSVEALFAETGLPRFMLDLRRVPPDSALGMWLKRPRLHRNVGHGYDPDDDRYGYHNQPLLAAYDGMIFIAESSAAKPLQ